MQKMYLLITITNRSDSDEFTSFFSSKEIPIMYSTTCQGTARQKTLALFGIEESLKSVHYCIVTENKKAELIKALTREMAIDLPNRGISVAIPLSSIGGKKTLEAFANGHQDDEVENEVKDECPLRADIVENGFDIMIVRELTGGIYFGERGMREGKYGEEAYDTECYSRMEIERIARVAFESAKKRRGKLISIDKANVLESSRLWRKVVHEIAEEYPEVECTDMLVDNAAMQLVRNPAQFDVIVTSNMFGDILSDEASQITGSIGMLPSASLNETTKGLYEPIHGSAPDIAGQNKANPIATILSGAMMLLYSFNLAKESEAIVKAVDKVLEAGYRTADLAHGAESLGTKEITDKIIECI